MTSANVEFSADLSIQIEADVPAIHAPIVELDEKDLAYASGGIRRGGRGGKDPEVPVSPN